MHFKNDKYNKNRKKLKNSYKYLKKRKGKEKLQVGTEALWTYIKYTSFM